MKIEGDFLRADYQWKRYRFLLSDGSTVDVVAIRDDSDLRAAVLQHAKGGKIEGVATVGEVQPAKVIKRGTAPVSSRSR